MGGDSWFELPQSVIVIETIGYSSDSDRDSTSDRDHISTIDLLYSIRDHDKYGRFKPEIDSTK